MLSAAASYLYIGERLWKDFVEHCRTDDAYAALKNLLFAAPETLDFRNVIFNTEAHPIRKFR